MLKHLVTCVSVASRARAGEAAPVKRALLVLAVLLAGCGPQETCMGSGSVCSADQWTSLPTRGTGTQLMSCENGVPKMTYCANGCVATGTNSDVCN